MIVEATRLFKVTVSFGSVYSLISLPCFMSHASIPADVRAARGLPDDLIRISVGEWRAGGVTRLGWGSSWSGTGYGEEVMGQRGGGGVFPFLPSPHSSLWHPPCVPINSAP